MATENSHVHQICDWCHSSTTNIQIDPTSKVKLCPKCCPDTVMTEQVVDAYLQRGGIPPQWHFMDSNEKEEYIQGADMDEIREEFDWANPPQPTQKEADSLMNMEDID